MDISEREDEPMRRCQPHLVKGPSLFDLAQQGRNGSTTVDLSAPLNLLISPFYQQALLSLRMSKTSYRKQIKFLQYKKFLILKQFPDDYITKYTKESSQ